MVFFDKLLKAAKKILNRRGIKLNPYYLDGLGKGNFSFHGLGWDVEKQELSFHVQSVITLVLHLETREEWICT